MTFPISKPGIFYDFPIDVYHADPCPAPSLNQSIAKVLLDQSPLHAYHQHPRLGAKPADDEPAEKYVAAQAIGNAVHRMMIGRGRDVKVGEFDSWRTKDAQAFRDAADADGHIPILQKHFLRARAMVGVAIERLDGAAFYASAPGRGEVVLAWQEEGFWFRTMIDWLNDDLRTAWDLKTSAMSCAPHALPSLMLSGGWDVQAAMHERALDALDPAGRGRRKFRFVAQENFAPYACTICELGEAVLTMGRKKLDAAIRLWRNCLTLDVWPSYPPEVQYPEYPGWAESQWLNREIKEAAAERAPVNLLVAG